MTTIKRKLNLVAYKALWVVLSIVLLWGFGLSLLVAVLNIGVGYADNQADFRSNFLEMTANRERDSLRTYLTLTQRVHQQPPALQKPDDKASAANEAAEDSSYDFALNYPSQATVDTLAQHFDPAYTNFRFSVTDENGKLLLTNDPLYDQPEQDLLAATVTSETITVGERKYQTQKHFDDPMEAFNTVVYGNQASTYLENPKEYLLWYFSDPAIDAVYHSQVEVEMPSGTYITEMEFPTVEEAKAFNYEWQFGAGCTWKIISDPEDIPAPAETAPQQESAPVFTTMPGGEYPEMGAATRLTDRDGNEYPSDGETVLVEVTAYSGTEISEIPLGEYYAIQSEGGSIHAVDDELERKLNQGLDITIRASHVDTKECYIRCYLPETLPVDDTIRANYRAFMLVFQHAESVVVLFFSLLALTVISCICMCTAAGRDPATGVVNVSQVHKLPFEAFWIMPVIVFAASVGLVYLLENANAPYHILAIFCVGLTLCIAATSILWLYTTAVRVKSGTFWRSFLAVRVLYGFWSLMRTRLLASLTTVIGLILTALLNFLCLTGFPGLRHLALPLLLITIWLDIMILLLTVYCIYAYFELKEHAKQIQSGDFLPAAHPLPLLADFSSFDQSLNDITAGVEEIVARQTKAEHMRTELITNVSHDLKTPLTSIVNYVDLLSREPMQTDAAREYLEVLRRQAARLKKLTVDLVDASKASTGNLTVELMPTDIQMLLGQLAGEYEEALAARQLSLVLHLPEEPLVILADGRQLWRVFDNLLNNACKYALSGTRVYVDAARDDGQVCIIMKNISATPLNISPDELMERFVRGDSSRSTEGSGLGLSIARDLTALQNGLLTLATDGDLFKAQFTFPLYVPPNSPDETAVSPMD